MRPGEQEPRGGGDDDEQVETPEGRAAEVLGVAQVDDVVHQEDEPRDDADDEGDHVALFGRDDQRQDRRDDDGKPEGRVEVLEEGRVGVARRFTLSYRTAAGLDHPDILPAPPGPKVDRPGRRVRPCAGARAGCLHTGCVEPWGGESVGWRERARGSASGGTC